MRDIDDTISKRRSIQRSSPSARRCNRPDFSNDILKAMSISKSCTCSQHCARQARATSQPVGAHTIAGATVMTTSGRQNTCRTITGNELMANDSRCRIRLSAPGLEGTQTGARHTSTPRHRSRR